MDRTQELDRALRTRGYRVTRPRRAVWEVLRDAGEHLTVDEIVERTADHDAGINVASVYRTLALLDELGLARVSRLGGSEAGRWELAHPDEHFHLVCQRCGTVSHHVGTLVEAIRDHLDADHGFAVEGVDLVVTGLCAECRR